MSKCFNGNENNFIVIVIDVAYQETEFKIYLLERNYSRLILRCYYVFSTFQ